MRLNVLISSTNGTSTTSLRVRQRITGVGIRRFRRDQKGPASLRALLSFVELPGIEAAYNVVELGKHLMGQHGATWEKMT